MTETDSAGGLAPGTAEAAGEMEPGAAFSVDDDSLSAVVTRVIPLTGVRAGSALVRHQHRLLLAQDDDYTLFWLDPTTDPVAAEAIALRGESGAMAKTSKPDFEAATLLPDGRILVIGSGSAAPRRAVVLLDPATGEFELHDAGAVYDHVGDVVGHEINIEAVLPIDGGLLLFHRGNSGPGNVTIDLEVDVTDPTGARTRTVTNWDIGTVPGTNGDVALTFTDADIDTVGRHWYIAAAEDTPNAIDDGPVVGAAIGLLETGSGRWTAIREGDGSISCRKYEGLVVDEDLRGAWVVTDPDDEELVAELCRIELTGWDS